MARDCIDTNWEFTQALPFRATRRLTTLIDQVPVWQERARSRQQLLSFDDRMLHDLGIDRATAQEEGGLPFWRTRR